MFNKKEKVAYAKAVNMTPDQFDEFIKRLRGYINKYLEFESISTNILISGFQFAVDVQKNSKKEKVKINFASIQSVEIKKYGKEILDLRLEGMGATRICKTIKSLHNANISISTMNRYLKLNGDYDNGKS
jgi:hypothetical protein